MMQSRDQRQYDIESLVTLKKGHWWSITRNKTESKSIDLSMQQIAIASSIDSNRLSATRLRERGATNASSTSSLLPRAQSPKSEAQASFLRAITKEWPVSQSLETACKWYIIYLEDRVRKFWVQLFRPVLANVDYATMCPSDDEISRAFRLFEVIVWQLEKDIPGGLALSDIIDELYNECPDRRLIIRTDQDCSHARLLVFAAFGWISFIYKPKYVTGSKNFEIHDPFEKTLAFQRISFSVAAPVAQRSICPLFQQREAKFSRKNDRLRGSGRFPRNRSKIFTKFQTSFDRWDQPLQKMIHSFGNTVPKRRNLGISGYETHINNQRESEEKIELCLVSFDTLSRLGAIEIEWVDCLNLHLEFDSRTKILRVFRFPSLCLIMGCTQYSALRKIFAAHDSAEYGFPQDGYANDFFVEIIMSYRLLFGQRERAYSRFKELIPLWQSQLQDDLDPLLFILCGQSWDCEDVLSIYDQMDVGDLTETFIATELFPFLGTRLLLLQKNIQNLNPRNLRELWRNDTNTLGWWTFWAVFFAGGGGLILGLIQALLSVLQVIYTKK